MFSVDSEARDAAIVGDREARSKDVLETKNVGHALGTKPDFLRVAGNSAFLSDHKDTCIGVNAHLVVGFDD